MFLGDPLINHSEGESESRSMSKLKWWIMIQSTLSLLVSMFFFSWALKSAVEGAFFNRGLFCFALSVISSVCGIYAGVSRRRSFSALAAALTAFAFAGIAFIYGMAVGRELMNQKFTEMHAELIAGIAWIVGGSLQVLFLAASALHDTAEDSFSALGERATAKAVLSTSLVQFCLAFGYWMESTYVSFNTFSFNAAVVWFVLPMTASICGFYSALEERARLSAAHVGMQLLALGSAVAYFIVLLLGDTADHPDPNELQYALELVMWAVVVVVSIVCAVVHLIRLNADFSRSRGRRLRGLTSTEPFNRAQHV